MVVVKETSSSIGSILTDAFHLIGQSLLYSIVIGGGNLVGLIIMMICNNHGLNKNVFRTIATVFTVPIALLIIILSPLAFILSIREFFHESLNKLLSIYLPFAKVLPDYQNES